MLITQNIDDLHNQEVRESTILQKTVDKYYTKSDNTDIAFTPHVYEIHGSVLYMHCEAEGEKHSNKFFEAPSLTDAENFAKALDKNEKN